MKKYAFYFWIVLFVMIGYTVFATEAEDNNGDIPVMTIEEFMLMNKAKQAKVDIIKKNNYEMENLKTELKNKIMLAAEKINSKKIEISNGNFEITDDSLQELRDLLQFLQDSKKTLENDVERTSSEIDKILDLIVAKGIQLEQYDKIIEKQNEVIVGMKSIMSTVEKI